VYLGSSIWNEQDTYFYCPSNIFSDSLYYALRSPGFFTDFTIDPTLTSIGTVSDCLGIMTPYIICGTKYLSFPIAHLNFASLFPGFVNTTLSAILISKLLSANSNLTLSLFIEMTTYPTLATTDNLYLYLSLIMYSPSAK
jgi:hypothetical protein